ncbi:ATP-binding protein [Paracoccus aerodenitrificans]|uniref:ATP-binding protein n=1 Tax=Paracoccus aerodenitrificans TaxID=3017781 RepID=UPI0022F0ECAA|nr:ATP-binding protein [Paracoccus aerodenitrificans]WBU64178.1 ATP-binding protein [Paracoccus aerodenitrificans]
MSFDTLVFAALIYVGFLFTVAWAADRAASRGRTGWTDRPIVYTLSLSVYCTAWTFYGAVGYADRSGLEFATIYLGPTVVLAGSWWGLRRLVRVARMHRVTSVADLISARFGKSNPLAALITLISLIAATPYLALQLQSIALSFAAFGPGDTLPGPLNLWVAAGLAGFAILFGTRNLAADERHYGVVMAIALEAIVKLIAFVVLGVWVIWGLADGPQDVIARIAQRAAGPDAAGWVLKPDRWTALIAVSAAAVLTLPRMFQVLVIEPADETPLNSAAWAFPAYLMAMSLFVLPIAVIGWEMLPPEVSPDLYVLHLPLSQGNEMLALLVFLGGLSSATSMVIISAIALATMISNHWFAPALLSLRRAEHGDAVAADLRGPLLASRRLAILTVIALGAVYQSFGGAQALAAMGTVAFVGVAQLLPAMLGGLLWRGATRMGAYAGIIAGVGIWLLLVFLPSLGLLPMWPLGPVDALSAAVFISLGANIFLFVGVSLITLPDPQERLQGLSFVHAVTPDLATATGSPRQSGGARSEALLALSRRVWGGDEALRFFRAEADRQGKSGFLPDVNAGFLSRLERRLAGAVGSATAHAMLAQFAGQRPTTMAELMAVAGEAQRAKERARQLKDDSDELARIARRLQEANDRLTAVSAQKDAFLGQISHELRTPMTSIRAFSELMKLGDIPAAERERFAGIIHDEASRLTRLLDDLLDLSVLESGRARLSAEVVNLHDLISRAIEASSSAGGGAALTIDRDLPAEHLMVITDKDRLLQVLINIFGNARKYCDAERPIMTIRTRRTGNGTEIDIMDNGSGIASEQQDMIFEKFSRLEETHRAGGAGLGLAISREVMEALGGSITYLPGHGGAAFRLELLARPPGFGRGAE